MEDDQLRMSVAGLVAAGGVRLAPSAAISSSAVDYGNTSFQLQLAGIVKKSRHVAGSFFASTSTQLLKPLI